MSKVKKISSAVAICIGFSCLHMASADIKLTIVDQDANPIVLGATSQSESGSYIDSSNWDYVPPAGSGLSSGYKYDYELHNNSGTSAHTLVAEIALKFYSSGATTYLGTCYLITSNADDGAGNDYSAGLLGSPAGFVDSNNNYVPMVEEYGPSQRNTCPYAKASFSNSGGGGNPEIEATISANMPSFTTPPQMQATLITNSDSNGKPLYRVDIQSGVLSSSQPLTQFTFIPYFISYAPSYNFLPPVKILNTGSNSYQYEVSNSDFYIEAPDVGGHPSIGGWEGLNYNNRDATDYDNATLPTQDPTAGLHAKDFAVNLIAPYGTNGSQSVVDPNGMNQVPLRVLICYAPGGVSPASCVLNYNGGAGGSNDHGPITPSYIISPDYHPELMYLYKQVYFNDLDLPAGQQLITGLQGIPSSGGRATAVTTIENYPGPYAEVPGMGGISGNSYQGIGSQSTTMFNNNPSWYFLSTTQTTAMQIQPNLMINGKAVQSSISNNQGIIITPMNHSAISASQYGHSISLSNGNGSIPVYNANLFDNENSAAVYFDSSDDTIRGTGEYSITQSNDYKSMSNGSLAPYYNNSMVFVNSDGTLTVPDNYLNKQYTPYASASSEKSNPFTVVDVFGDLVEVN